MNTLLAMCLLLAIGYFMYTVVCAFIVATKKHDRSTAHKMLCLGTFAAAFCYYIPFYCSYFSELDHWICFLKSIFLSIHHAIRLFIVDVNYDEIRNFCEGFGLFGDAYSCFGILLFVVAPVLTFTFIVSFLQDVTTVVYVRFGFGKNYYIFSEINPNAVHLAQDIRQRHPKANIVFLGVDKENKSTYETIKTYTRHIYPTLLSTDILRMNYLMGRYKKDAKYFIISENEEDNTAMVLSILDDTPHKSKREIYVRLDQSDRLLDDLPAFENTEIFRVEHVYSVVNYELEKLGSQLFQSAKPDGNGIKVISVLTVGLGRYGTEMIKSLAWFTQVEGYTTKIHAFEQDLAAAERLEHLCPGLFGEDTTDRHFDIVIHSGLTYGTSSFDHKLEELGDISFVFIALGNDNLNVNAAFDIRKSFAGMGKHPIIQTVLRNGDAGKLLSDSKNYRGMSCDIDFIGSYEEIYRLDFITDIENKEAAIQENLKWFDQKSAKELLSHEERYHMEKSRLIHKRLLQVLNIPNEKQYKSEHRRWVNYMLSEGYLYGPKRNDFAKRHPLLIPYDQLEERYKYVLQ